MPDRAEGRVVLVVEDDVDIANVILDILNDEGYSPILAATAVAAAARAQSQRPDLVLLDWNLPDGSGEDVVRAIRPVDPTVPIVVMSGARDALQDSLLVEARERLFKPFDRAHLLALVRRYCG